MLRASSGGDTDNPVILLGLTEENISRLKDYHPINISMRSCGVHREGSIAIIYGRTHAELEEMLAPLLAPDAHGTCDPRTDQLETIQRDHRRILVATVGLPRSGKSTWARRQSYPVVNPDSIRLALHGQPFIGLAEPFVWAIAKTMVRALFLAGHQTVILDATNITRARRDEWKSRDWETFFQEFNASQEECLGRTDDPGLREAIERMAGQREPLGQDEKVWP